MMHKIYIFLIFNIYMIKVAYSGESNVPIVFGHETDQLSDAEENEILKSFDEGHELLAPHEQAGRLSSWIDTRFYLPRTGGNLSKECLRDVRNILLRLQAPSQEKDTKNFLPQFLFAQQLVDSWGKFSDGYIYGNWDLYGAFDECLGVEVIPNKLIKSNFIGQYCKMAYKQLEKDTDLYSEKELEEYRKKLEVKLNTRKFQPIPALLAQVENTTIGYATCIPSTCTRKELIDSVNYYLKETNHILFQTDCQTKNDPIHLTASNYIGIVIFSILGLLLIAGTVVEVFTIFKPDSNLGHGNGRYLIAFSMWSNSKKIFGYNPEALKSQISCVHGIRVLSLCWVIFGHQFAFTAGHMNNIMMLDEMTEPLMMQTVINADKSVDSFFMIGGLFVAYGALDQLNKKKFSLLHYYLHRIIRLMPAIAGAAMFQACISTLLVQRSPEKDSFKYYIEKGCQRTWYMDVFFVSNIFIGDRMNYIAEDIIQSTCLGQSWYTSCDMQIYIFLPLVILPLFYKRYIGLAWLTFWTIFSMAIRGIIIWAKDMPGAGTWVEEPDDDSFQALYVNFYTRMCSVLVGIWVGFILYEFKDKRIKLSPYQVALGWIASLLMLALVLYGIQPYEHAFAEPMPMETTILYQSFQRATWAAGLGWVVIACHWGYGGFVNWFLSLAFWQPLSRLSYTMFLMAIPLQGVYISRKKSRFYLDYYTVFEQTTGLVIACLPFALLLSLMTEGPILNLEKLLRGSPSNTTTGNKSESIRHVEINRENMESSPA